MSKIPVGKTIARAYGFAFRDFFRILGVMWLAIAVTWIPGIVLQQYMMAHHIAPAGGAAFREMWPVLLPFYLLICVILFMQIIGIAKLALGIRRGPAWFYFSLGKPVWRLIGSFFLLTLALILGWLLVLLGGAILGFVATLLARAISSSLFSTILGAVSVIAMVALWCAYIYAFVRLTFLLVPVIAAEEEGFALARSWTLGLRNFWRMLVILLATVGPFFVLEMAFVFGFLLHGLSFPPAHASAVQMAAFQAAMNTRAVELVGILSHNWYLTYPVIVILMVIFYGAIVGAQCFAWRALTQSDGLNPIAAD